MIQVRLQDGRIDQGLITEESSGEGVTRPHRSIQEKVLIGSLGEIDILEEFDVHSCGVVSQEADNKVLSLKFMDLVVPQKEFQDAEGVKIEESLRKEGDKVLQL